MVPQAFSDFANRARQDAQCAACGTQTGEHFASNESRKAIRGMFATQHLNDEPAEALPPPARAPRASADAQRLAMAEGNG